MPVLHFVLLSSSGPSFLVPSIGWAAFLSLYLSFRVRAFFRASPSSPPCSVVLSLFLLFCLHLLGRVFPGPTGLSRYASAPRFPCSQRPGSHECEGWTSYGGSDLGGPDDSGGGWPGRRPVLLCLLCQVERSLPCSFLCPAAYLRRSLSLGFSFSWCQIVGLVPGPSRRLRSCVRQFG